MERVAFLRGAAFQAPSRLHHVVRADGGVSPGPSRTLQEWSEAAGCKPTGGTQCLLTNVAMFFPQLPPESFALKT